ncbi:MAG TPA: cytochrome b/b6 domain-containing protein [Steroidobacteraceae bacterium]
MATQRRSGAVREAGLVWDWPVRAFHWGIVICVAGAWATHYAGIEWFDWHRRLGYSTLVLVAFRVVWGFVGPRHARFVSFVRGPRAIVEYLAGHASGAALEPGHNPLGALSVVAFLLVLLLQAATGLFANDEVANAGPFFGWVDQQTSNRLSAVHHFNSNVLLGLVALHLLAVAYYDNVRNAGLTKTLVTGRKAGAEGIAGSRGWLALLIVALLSAALALAIRAAPEATISFF